MMATPLLLAKGVFLGFAISAPVGPVGLLCMDRSLRHGRLTGFVAGLGATLADTLYGGVAAFGMVSVTEFLLGHERILRLVGGLVLVALAWRTFFLPPPVLELRASNEKRPLLRVFGSSFLLTISNPMTVFAFMAIYASLGLQVESTSEAMTVLAGVFLGAASWWCTLSIGTVFLRHRLTPTILGRFSRLAGSLMGLFGLAALLQAIFSFRVSP